MAQFYAVNKDVLPLKANLAVMQGKYQAAKRELEAAEALLEAKEVNYWREQHKLLRIYQVVGLFAEFVQMDTTTELEASGNLANLP